MKLRLLGCLLFVANVSAQTPPPTIDETARFLAGLPVEGSLAPLMAAPAWQEHAKAMDEAWSIKMTQQVVPIRGWMALHAPGYHHSTDTMFYMFAGPDFLYANVFFPDASTYILAGLEPVGAARDLSTLAPAALAAELGALRTSMSSILRFQYFITKDMRADIGHGKVLGTVPIIYVFLARLGYQVLAVEGITSPSEGVKIVFQNPALPQPQTLYYFKTNLAGEESAFLKWCAAQGPGLSLLKAASFLMHGNNFNGVRKFLLEHSRVIVQDDSGIPLRAFPKGWEVNCYGHYVPHRTTFAKFTQPDLAAVYQRNPPGPLGFAFGYHWQKEEGMLMLATPPGGAPPVESVPVLRALPLAPEEQP